MMYFPLDIPLPKIFLPVLTFSHPHYLLLGRERGGGGGGRIILRFKTCEFWDYKDYYYYNNCIFEVETDHVTK